MSCERGSKSSVPFELYKPQLMTDAEIEALKSSVPFELYKPQHGEFISADAA